MAAAIEVYRTISAEIDVAERDRDIYLLPQLAERLGMIGGETHRGLSQRWEYSFTDPDGDTVQLHCRWYDTSQAFSPGPDRHIMTVAYRGGQGSLSHAGSYDE